MRFAAPFGAYEINSFPSQPQVAHCHGLFVRHELRAVKANQFTELKQTTNQ